MFFGKMTSGADKGFVIPTPEKLISILNVDDIDEAWVMSELNLLESTAEVYNNDPKCKQMLKDQVVETLSSVAKESHNICNLIRVLYRLAKSQTTTEQLCNEVVTAVSANLSAQMPPAMEVSKRTTTTYGNENEKAAVSFAKVVKSKNSPRTSKPIQPTAEITLIPQNNYDADLKKVSSTLKGHRINSARKSKAGNIVLNCENDDEVKRVEDTLKTTDFVALKKMEKNFPKMTIFGAEIVESNEELKNDIIARNPFIRSLVEDSGKKFDILFMKKFKGLNNVTIKVDPEIRNAILNNNAKCYVGLKRCHVSDSFPFKVCFNCQKTCSHLSSECESSVKICRYCGLNHFSKDCPVQNDST